MHKLVRWIPAAMLLLAACSHQETTETGISYQILQSSGDTRQVATGDQLSVHMLMTVDRNDSVIFDTYKSGQPFTIPADEPTLGSVFMKLHKGDSVEFWIPADTLYTKSFGVPRPASILASDMIHFHITLSDVYNMAELQKQMKQKQSENLVKDSVALSKYLADKPDVQKTASGLMYQVLKKGNGKMAEKGKTAVVTYKGMLLDGTVFDETKPERPEFSFKVGMNMVIAGWDEGLQLMKEGDSFRFIIPYKLAYGEQGTGPIPPCSTLVFEVELLKVQ